MTSSYPRAAMLAFLDRAHAAHQELYLTRGELRLVGKPDPTLATALRLLAPQLREELAPWVCPWCGRDAELPDGCSLCWAALRHYVREGSSFAVGPRIAHAFSADSFTRTSCGIDLEGLDAPPLHFVFVAPGSVCRRCLVSLKREYAMAHPRRVRG